MMTARVVLRGAETYKVHGRTWIKGVPGVVKGEDQIKAFEQNGYFHVKRLESKKQTPNLAQQKKLVKRPAPEAKPEETN